MTNGRNRNYANVIAVRRAAEQRKVEEQRKAATQKAAAKARLQKLLALRRAIAKKAVPKPRTAPAPRPLPQKRAVSQPSVKPKISPIKKAIDEQKEFVPKPFQPKSIPRPSSRPRPTPRPRPMPTPQERTATATLTRIPARTPAPITKKYISREVAAVPRNVPALKSRPSVMKPPVMREAVRGAFVGARVPRDVVRGAFVGARVPRDVVRGARVGRPMTASEIYTEKMKSEIASRGIPGLTGEIYGEAKLIPGYNYPRGPTTEEMKASLRERGLTGKFVEPITTKEEQFRAATNGGIPSPGTGFFKPIFIGRRQR